jgi:hypothetical protein
MLALYRKLKKFTVDGPVASLYLCGPKKRRYQDFQVGRIRGAVASPQRTVNEKSRIVGGLRTMTKTQDALKFVKADDQPAGEVPGRRVDPSPLLGTWLATDRATGGIVKLVLSTRGDELVVHAFGACSPSPCDWGEVKGSAFSDAVTSSLAMSFTCVYDFGFLQTILAAYLKGGILVLDSFNTFKDGSGRADYFTREFYYRAG